MFALDAVKKDSVYKLYKIVVKNPKEYTKLNRKEMLKEIIENYDVYDLCTLRELDFLNQVLQGISDLDSIQYRFENETLEKKLLVLDGEIPNEFVDMVKNVLSTLDVDQKKKEDRNLEIAIGYIRLMGVVAKEDLEALLTDQSFLARKLFKFYVDMQEDTYIYRDDLDVLKDLKSQKKKYNISRYRRFSYDTYVSYFYYGYDVLNLEVKQFFDLFYESFSQEENRIIALNAIEKSVLCHVNRSIAKAIVSSFDCVYDELVSNFDFVLDQMPSGALNGYCANDLKFKCIKNEYIDRQCRNREFEQNALISPKDTRNFLKLYFSILEFINEKYHIYPGLAIRSTDSAIMPALNEIIARFWENKEEWLMEYCEANPLNLSLQNLEVVKNFSYGIRKPFMVYKFEGGYTQFVDEKHVYLVKGLADRVDRLIANNEYPIFLKTCLLPYHGDIVYAASLELFCGDVEDYKVLNRDVIRELKPSFERV